MRRSILVLLALIVPSLACDNSSSSSTTTPTVPLTSQTFTGTIDAGGSSSNTTFVVTQTGEVDVTLTAVGPPPNIYMNLAIGVPSTTDSSCVAPATAGQLVQASTTPLTGTLQAGTYCVKLYDAGYMSPGSQVSYTLTVAHP
jgi:hypothetical protein